MHSAVMHWPMAHTEEPADPEAQKTRSSGNGLMRSLELAAKEAGVEIPLEHRMTSIHRQTPNPGAVRCSGSRSIMEGEVEYPRSGPSSSAPAARPVTSTSVTGSTRT
jgi:hypothetical protein